jgi:phospholipid/cholesterol/gamma-HCH transport system substrate-binding protein
MAKELDWRDLLRLNQVRNFLVGAVLLASAIVFFAAGAAYMLHNDLFERRYVAYALFEDGTGMSKGAKVLVNGVQVGTVEDVRLTPEARVVLELVLKQRYSDLIRRNSVAYFKRDRNVVSDRVLNIEKGDPTAPVLRPGDTLSLGPPQDIETALGSLANLTVQFRATLTRVDSLLKMVTDTNTTIGAVLVKDDLYRRTLATVNALNRTIGTSDRTMARLEKLSIVAEDRIPRILSSADTLGRQLRHTATTADSLGTAGLQLVHSAQDLADHAQGIARDGDVLVGKGNRLLQGIERSWLLGGFMAPGDPPDKRVPLGPLP